MDNPKVLIVSEPSKDRFKIRIPKIPLKKLLPLVIIIIVPAILLLLNTKLNLKNLIPDKNAPRLIRQGNLADLPLASTSAQPLFFADLEYNPKTKGVIQLKTGRTQGEIPKLLEIAPTASNAKLNYKLQTLSDKDKLLHLGWVSLDKNNLKFRVVTAYQPNAKTTIYMQGVGPIWTITMP